MADRVPAAEEHTSVVFGVTQLLKDHRPSFLFNSVMPIVPSLPERFTLASLRSHRKAATRSRRLGRSSRGWNLHREPPVVPCGPTTRGAPFGAPLVSIFAPFCFGTPY